MIRVILSGRTGNNLFQYAAGRALAIRHRTALVLDGAWANDIFAKQFVQFKRLPIAATYERRMTVAKRTLRKVFNLGPQRIHRGIFFSESALGFDPEFLHLPEQTTLDGFFQSPRYFEGIEPELRKELDLGSLPLPKPSLDFEDQIRRGITVSIHIRRGDYLAIDATNCLAEDYHDLAISRFRDAIENVRFCVFSDDIAWCQRNFKGSEFLFCNLPASANDPLHDLRLMSACSHHIIANSSYSWWGAWLNNSPGKTVIAPAMWMKGLPSSQVIPQDWITI